MPRLTTTHELLDEACMVVWVWIFFPCCIWSQAQHINSRTFHFDKIVPFLSSFSSRVSTQTSFLLWEHFVCPQGKLFAIRLDCVLAKQRMIVFNDVEYFLQKIIIGWEAIKTLFLFTLDLIYLGLRDLLSKIFMDFS